MGPKLLFHLFFEHRSQNTFLLLMNKSDPHYLDIFSVLCMCSWASAGGSKIGISPPLEIGTKDQNFFENLELAANFGVIHLIIALTVYLSVYDTDHHTAQEPSSLFWCHAMMRLQFTRALSFACRSRLRTLLADCSTVGLYCATITRQ